MEYVDAPEASKLDHNRIYTATTASKVDVTGILAIDGLLMNTLRAICDKFPGLPAANIHLPNIQPETHARLAATGRCSTALMEVEAYLRALTPEQLLLLNSAYLDFCGSAWGCEAINSKPLETIHYLLKRCLQRVFVLATTFSVRSGRDVHASRGKNMYETIEEDMLYPCFQYSGYRVTERYCHRYARIIDGEKGTNMVFFVHVLVRDESLDTQPVYFPRSKKRCNGVVVIEGWRQNAKRRVPRDASTTPKYIPREYLV